jgi:hypothetical protein
MDMSDALCEAAIVRALALEAAQRIARRVISELEGMKDKLSGDDTELKTIWDEICVQVQDQKSIFWEVYGEIVRGMVRGHVAELAKYEREAIWLQTDAGLDWVCEEPKDREAHPVFDDDIVNYLVHDYVFSQAADWSNAPIEAYLARSGMRD